jgi:hypothetical protein
MPPTNIVPTNIVPNVVPSAPRIPGIDPITSGVQAAAAIAQTISAINDANKRRNYDFAIGRMSADRQQELNKQLLSAKNLNERLAILANAVATVRAQEVRSRIEGVESAERNKMIIIVGGAFAILITAFLIRKV